MLHNFWKTFKLNLTKVTYTYMIQKKSKILNFMTEIAVTFSIVHTFSYLGLGFSFCNGPSMLPTLDQDNQLVFIDKFSYRILLKDYKVGDVVISTSKENPLKNVCKRIKAVAGDHVVYNIDRINGTVTHMTVPIGHVWLAGDNCNNSNDSRMYGPMPIGMLQGRVFLKIGLKPLHIAFIDTIVLNDKYPAYNKNNDKKSLNLSKDSIHEDNRDKDLKSYVINNSNIIYDINKKQRNNNENQNKIQAIHKVDNDNINDNNNKGSNEDQSDNKKVNKINSEE